MFGAALGPFIFFKFALRRSSNLDSAIPFTVIQLIYDSRRFIDVKKHQESSLNFWTGKGIVFIEVFVLNTHFITNSFPNTFQCAYLHVRCCYDRVVALEDPSVMQEAPLERWKWHRKISILGNLWVLSMDWWQCIGGVTTGNPEISNINVLVQWALLWLIYILYYSLKIGYPATDMFINRLWGICLSYVIAITIFWK